MFIYLSFYKGELARAQFPGYLQSRFNLELRISCFISRFLLFYRRRTTNDDGRSQNSQISPRIR